LFSHCARNAEQRRDRPDALWREQQVTNRERIKKQKEGGRKKVLSLLERKKQEAVAGEHGDWGQGREGRHSRGNSTMEEKRRKNSTLLAAIRSA